MARLQTLSTSKVSVLEQRTVVPEPKRVDPCYLDARWLALVARLKVLRGQRCQACSRTKCRLYGDHIVELADGGEFLDSANVQLLCGKCHTLKTNAARLARLRQPLLSATKLDLDNGVPRYTDNRVGLEIDPKGNNL